MNLVDILFNAGTGGIVGAIGSLGKGWIEHKQRQAEMEHEENMARLRAKIATEQASWEAFTASQKAAAPSENEHWLAGAVRSATRPLITFSLFGLSAYIAWSATDELKAEIHGAILSMTSTAIVWWFGSRPTFRFSSQAKE